MEWDEKIAKKNRINIFKQKNEQKNNNTTGIQKVK